jgi:hypothetical protein
MSNIRTVNKRHKRAIVTSHARNKAEKALLEAAKPVKVAV